MTEKLILSEIYQLPETLKMEVLHFASFLKEEYKQKKIEKIENERVFGKSKGRYKIAPDFNAPLDDFKEYM
jgi:Protein of unknown function (DUF2281)